MGRNLKIWTYAWVGTIASVIASILFVDRPVALFVHDNLRQPALFATPLSWPEPVVPAALIIILSGATWVFSGRPLVDLGRIVLKASAAVIFAASAKTTLKIVFGRTWPETFTGNRSFIQDGEFAFHPFSIGRQFESFPSGHMAITLAFITILWFDLPRFRLIYAAGVAWMAGGLIGMNYHFVSDVIAGGFVGFLSAFLVDRATALRKPRGA